MKRAWCLILFFLSPLCFAQQVFDSRYGIYSDMTKVGNGLFKGMEIILLPSEPQDRLVFTYSPDGQPGSPASFRVNLGNLTFAHPQFGRVYAVADGTQITLQFADGRPGVTLRKTQNLKSRTTTVTPVGE